MFLGIKKENADKIFPFVEHYALKCIIMYPMKTKEKLLSKYLFKKYNKTLKELCFILIRHAKICKTRDNYIIIAWPVMKYKKLANLITFGNERTPGSNILKSIFDWGE